MSCGSFLLGASYESFKRNKPAQMLTTATSTHIRALCNQYAPKMSKLLPVRKLCGHVMIYVYNNNILINSYLAKLLTQCCELERAVYCCCIFQAVSKQLPHFLEWERGSVQNKLSSWELIAAQSVWWKMVGGVYIQ